MSTYSKWYCIRPSSYSEKVGHVPHQLFHHQGLVIDDVQVVALLFRGVSNAVLDPSTYPLMAVMGVRRSWERLAISSPRSSWAPASRHGGGLQALADALQGLAELIQLPQLAGEDLKVQLPVPQVVCRPAQGFSGWR